MTNPPLLTLHGLSKSFAGVTALAPVTLSLRTGEILGLVGENGAGKSTLIKLLSGIHTPDSGEIHWNGKSLKLSSPRDALAAGIATIHQELEYCSTLSVAENMLLGEPWPRYRWGGVNWNALHTLAAERLASAGLAISTHARFAQLTAAEKQEVAIANALSRNARLLILDEPTASLTGPEVERLFGHLRRLKSQGVTMLYVSHRLDEIFRMCDRVAVLRDGELVGEHATGDVTVDRIIEQMVGRPLDQAYRRTHARTCGEPLLELQNATCAGMFQGVTFDVHAGEIVGLAGLVGAGRSELARAIYGLYPLSSGSMRLRGEHWRPSNPRAALARGLIYLPEERKRQGLVLEHSVRTSLLIGFSDLLTRCGLVRPAQARTRVTDVLRKYDVRTAGTKQPVGTLSGGNQQKVMLGRWLEREPEVIVLDEPTRGVDVGAKAEIHALIDALAARGKAVLLISSDLPEVLRMSDRVLVMNRGRISAELEGDRLTEKDVMLAAATDRAEN